MAKLSWLKSGEPFSEQFQDFYFSTDGGLQETEYVFLRQNNFPQRFHSNQQALNNKTLRIAETGFGTGLNFLVTAYHWLQNAAQDSILEYTAIEKYPLTKLQLTQVYQVFNQSWPQLHSCCSELLGLYPDTLLSTSPFLRRGSEGLENQYELKLFAGKIHLKLIIDDATAGLKQLLPTNNKMDAWYLDGFAPAKNPEMWQIALFETMAELSKSGTTLGTFTSAGIVRRGLIEAGFEISKIPGLGKKREILAGIKK